MSQFFNNIAQVQNMTAEAMNQATSKQIAEQQEDESKKRDREGLEVPLGIEALQLGLQSGRLAQLGKHLGNKVFGSKVMKKAANIQEVVKSFKKGGYESVIRDASKIPKEQLREMWDKSGSKANFDDVLAELKSKYGSKEEAIVNLHSDMKKGLMGAYDKIRINAKSAIPKKPELADFNKVYQKGKLQIAQKIPDAPINEMKDEIQSRVQHPVLEQEPAKFQFVNNGAGSIQETPENPIPSLLSKVKKTFADVVKSAQRAPDQQIINQIQSRSLSFLNTPDQDRIQAMRGMDTRKQPETGTYKTPTSLMPTPETPAYRPPVEESNPLGFAEFEPVIE